METEYIQIIQKKKGYSINIPSETDNDSFLHCISICNLYANKALKKQIGKNKEKETASLFLRVKSMLTSKLKSLTRTHPTNKRQETECLDSVECPLLSTESSDMFSVNTSSGFTLT